SGTSVDSQGNIIYDPGISAIVDSVAVINGANVLTWNNAGANGLWDLTTSNWNNGSASTVYTDGSVVTFNDSNNGAYAATLNTTVSPAAVLVNNSAGNYTIGGSGTIAGS